jgi:hypothetical protein
MSKRVWYGRAITFTQSEIDAMTLEDFGDDGLDDEDREILRNSESELLRRLASDDPEVRLQAHKEFLTQIVTVADKPAGSTKMRKMRKVRCKSCDKVGYLQPDQMSTNCPDPRCRENDEDAEVVDLGNVEISREELDKARPWR